MLASMLALGAGAGRELATRLHAVGGGNPSYTVEMVSALVDDGSSARAPSGTWHLAEMERSPASPFRAACGKRLAGGSHGWTRAPSGALMSPRCSDRVFRLGSGGLYRGAGSVGRGSGAGRIAHPTGDPARAGTGTRSSSSRSWSPGGVRAGAVGVSATSCTGPQLGPGEHSAAGRGRGRCRHHLARARPRSRTALALDGGPGGVAAALTGVAGALGGCGHSGQSGARRSPPCHPSAADLVPNRIVVAPLANRTGDTTLSPVGDMAADWIARGLTQTAQFQVVDPRTAWLTAKLVTRMPRLLRPAEVAVASRRKPGPGWWCPVPTTAKVTASGSRCRSPTSPRTSSPGRWIR